LRGAAASATTAVLNRFVPTCFHYLDAIPPMFRFTIRDVLWLTVVVALAVGWWIDHRKTKKLEAQYVDLSQRITSLVEQLEARVISTFIDPEGAGVVISENQVIHQAGPFQGRQPIAPPATPNRP
jgi:hypothetical protein